MMLLMRWRWDICLANLGISIRIITRRITTTTRVRSTPSRLSLWLTPRERSSALIVVNRKGTSVRLWYMVMTTTRRLWRNIEDIEEGKQQTQQQRQQQGWEEEGRRSLTIMI